ncbi:hypothetical protein DER45DRAFT_544809 [Fusarium avenaceum]|nr:hypothetical protein DER45DRAFT_544809 [Fusarium avenaceum]
MKARSSRRRDVDEEVSYDEASLEAISELQDAISGYEDLVRRLSARKTPDDFDSYEQDGEVSATNTGSNGPTTLPGPGETQELVKVYFSTIYIAYPFIPQSTFIAIYITYNILETNN